MLVLAIIFAPTFAGGEHEPVAHVSDFRRPATILLRQPFASAESLDDLFDLQKLGFGILHVFRPCERAFGTRTQVALKVTNLCVLAQLRFQNDIAASVVVDLRQRLVDQCDPLFDRLALASQL